MMEEAEPKSDPELGTSFAHTNICTPVITPQELVTLHHALGEGMTYLALLRASLAK